MEQYRRVKVMSSEVAFERVTRHSQLPPRQAAISLLDVSARAEPAVGSLGGCSGEDDHLCLGVLSHPSDRTVELSHELPVERISTFGPIEGDDSDPIRHLGEDDRPSSRFRFCCGPCLCHVTILPAGTQAAEGSANSRIRRANSRGRSLWTAWPAPSTTTTSMEGSRRCISATSSSRTKWDSPPRTSRVGIWIELTSSQSDVKSNWLAASSRCPPNRS